MMVVHRKSRNPLSAGAARGVDAFDVEQFVRELG
jgi:hypothetical protein